MVNGAEPISPTTLRKFTDRFGAYGMNRGVPSPSYGLAENCVGLCFPPFGRGPQIDRIKRESLAQRGYAEPADANDTDAFEVVACGHPIEKNEVRIVDNAGRELGERHEGMLEFRGPSITKGYFRNEEKTRELYHDGWVKSGDRAYIANGDIHLTGRVKDIIIRAGRNTYPHEIEEQISAIPGIRKGGVAAFGSADPATGTERLIVMAETKERNPEARAKMIAAAHEVVTAIAGSAADDIVLVPPRGVPKTSSGKVRRSSAKELYETGKTDVKEHGVWLQIARLAMSSAGRTVTNALRRVTDTLYAGWWWLITGLGFLFAYIAVMILPSMGSRWAALRGIIKSVFALTGVPVRVTGKENLPAGNAVILFNHTSYMDVLAIVAALPGTPAFVAKKEFENQAFAGSFMRRLGVAFVERFDASASLADADKISSMAKEGRLFVFFPEGTFTRRAGLMGFYMGAFKVAADANLPVVPGALARRANAAARRPVVPAPHGDRRHHRKADPAGRHRLLVHAGAARRCPRRHAETRRRAGSRVAGEAGEAENLSPPQGLGCSQRLDEAIPLSGCERAGCSTILWAPIDANQERLGGNHGLDHPDPRRNLHRPRDQRLSPRRILILDFLVLGAGSARA